MSYVLFYIKTGESIKVYNTESAARTGMRASNRNAGWQRVSRSWTDGIEMEWCVAIDNGQYEHGPYGITEYDRWNKRFSPTVRSSVYIS